MGRYSSVPRSLMLQFAESSVSTISRLLFSYMWSSHETHFSGIFSLSVPQHAKVLGCKPGLIRDCLRELQEQAVIEYDEEWSVVWIRGFRDHNAKGKAIAGIPDHLEQLPPSPVVAAYRRALETPSDGASHGASDGVQGALFPQEQDPGTGLREQDRQVRALWELFTTLRTRIAREIGQRVQPLKLTEDRKRRLRARLEADGYDACEYVIKTCASEAAAQGTIKWFNGVTMFRPDNFTRALSRTGTDSVRRGTVEAPRAQGVEDGERFAANARHLMGETH